MDQRNSPKEFGNKEQTKGEFGNKEQTRRKEWERE